MLVTFVGVFIFDIGLFMIASVFCGFVSMMVMVIFLLLLVSLNVFVCFI